MSDAFLGEIRMFSGDYAPRGWALCDGQILLTSEYPELYSLLSNVYGGDGWSTFALPDMRGRLPVHFGTGDGLTPLWLGARFGYEQEFIDIEQIPSHNHAMQASGGAASASRPLGQVLLAKVGEGDTLYSSAADKLVKMNSDTVIPEGESRPHDNMMPYTCVNFIICIKYATYPSRN